MTAIGQNSSLSIDSTQVCNETYIVVETMPEYPGGEEELLDFLQQMKLSNNCYFNQLRRVTFVVDKNGEVRNPAVIGLEGECAEEIEQQILKMKDWTPGYQKGQPVCVQFAMPIKVRTER